MRPLVAYRTQLTVGRFDGAAKEVPLTRDLYSEHRKVEVRGPSCRWSGGRADRLSWRLSVSLHRATGEQGDVAAPAGVAAGIRRSAKRSDAASPRPH